MLSALEGAPRSLHDLVADTGLSRATTYRLAVALEAHGLVRRDEEGRFTLGLRL
ncbi:MAG: helix-turn-helix domain-containing protein, partial [Deltaproteobacteria bacterium]